MRLIILKTIMTIFIILAKHSLSFWTPGNYPLITTSKGTNKMKYQTVLLIALTQFFLMLPFSFYLLSLNLPGLFFFILMLSGIFTIITIYYPLITINN